MAMVLNMTIDPNLIKAPNMIKDLRPQRDH